MPSWRNPVAGRHYGVARQTIKAALAQLRSEGRIKSQQGKGTFVREPCTPRGRELGAELTDIQERVRRLSEDLAAVQGALANVIDNLPVEENQSI